MKVIEATTLAAIEHGMDARKVSTGIIVKNVIYFGNIYYAKIQVVRRRPWGKHIFERVFIFKVKKEDMIVELLKGQDFKFGIIFNRIKQEYDENDFFIVVLDKNFLNAKL